MKKTSYSTKTFNFLYIIFITIVIITFGVFFYIFFGGGGWGGGVASDYTVTLRRVKIKVVSGGLFVNMLN